MRNFRTYKVWQRSIELVSKFYHLTDEIPNKEMYSLTRQMRRAAVSIPSNFAEGSARESDKEFKRFIEMSLGSAFELETQLIIASNLYHLDKHPGYDEAFKLLSHVQAELNALRNRLK
jgi:four helix bundle protein